MSVPLSADPARVRGGAVRAGAAGARTGSATAPIPASTVAELGETAAVFGVSVWMADPATAATTAAWLRERALSRLADEGVFARRRRRGGEVTPPPDDRRSTYDDVLAHVAHKRRKRRSPRAPPQPPLGAGHDGGGGCWSACCALFAAVGVAGAVFVHDTLSGVSLDTLEADPPGINSQIYDRDGHLLETISSTENRTPVAFSQISPWLKTATVDIEDRRFYQHGGLDFQGILRAAVDNLQAGVDPAGRLDARAAAGAKPLPVRRAVVDAQGARGLPGHADGRPVVEGQDPRRVPERGALRRRHLRLRGGRAALLQPPLHAAEPAPGGAAGRPAAEPDHLQPAVQPAGRQGPPQRGAAGDARRRPHQPRPSTRRPSPRRSAPAPVTTSTAPAATRATSCRGCARRWRRSSAETRSRRADSRSTPRSTRSCRTPPTGR